mgnify:CR=1 FL=1
MPEKFCVLYNQPVKFYPLKDVNNFMRKLFALIIALSFVMPSFANSTEYTEGDTLVVLKSSETLNASSFTASGAGTLRASEFAAASGGEVRRIYPALSEAGKGIFMLMHSDTQDPEAFSAMLLENPEVLAASPNYKVKAAMIPNDPHYDSCWGMEYINAPSAWDSSTGSSNVYVAIIDSGIDYTNPDLTENTTREYGINTINNNASALDDYGHGTHVAGTIGAKGNNGMGVAGINWNVRMIPVKALDNEGSGTFETVIGALEYVTELINSGVNIKAVNMSLETYIKVAPERDTMVKFPLWRAFKALDETNKAVIVVAAGNHSVVVGQPSTRYVDSTVSSAGYYVYPASFTGLYNMISVSALTRLGTQATYSNTGADVSAPGGELSTLLSAAGILSTWLQSATSYIASDGVSLRSAQGTSMAAPHISGAVALLASVNSKMSAYQLKQSILRQNASSASLQAASDTEFDLNASVNYQNDNAASLPASGTQWADYDNYADYEVDQYIGYESSGGDSGGGCESVALFGFLPAVVMVMLARKRIS